MFTGLVECMGTVRQQVNRGQSSELSISAPFADEIALGESIAINGCCLTVVSQNEAGDLAFDVGAETLAKTNLGSLEIGEAVNLERALLASARLGGHFVQGHIDGTGKIRAISEAGPWRTVWFEIGALTEFLVPKGSIAVDGISLTVVDVRPTEFSVMVIPHTLAVTNLGNRRVGQTVNIEVDILGKYIHKMISAIGPTRNP